MKDLICVEVRPEGDGWVADRPGLPGAPLVGRGKTWLEACGDLLVQDPEWFGIRTRVFDKNGDPVPPSFFGAKYRRD